MGLPVGGDEHADLVIVDEHAGGDARDVSLHVASARPGARAPTPGRKRRAPRSPRSRPLPSLPSPLGSARRDRPVGSRRGGPRRSTRGPSPRPARPVPPRGADREVTGVLVGVDAPELSHGAGPPSGRRRGSGRRGRRHDPLGAPRGTSPPGLAGSSPGRSSDRGSGSGRPRSPCRRSARPPAGEHRAARRRPLRTRARRASARAGRSARRSSARATREALPRVDGPLEPELRRRVVGQGVLPDVHVPLLEPKHLERVQTVRRQAERNAGLLDRAPELRTARTRMMELERDLPDETGADRATAGRPPRSALAPPCAGTRPDRSDPP